MWEYSKGNRRTVILYIALSIFATLVIALEPLIVGFFLNTIQNKGVTKESLPELISILSMLFFLEIVFWSLHGPSRVMENRNAFFAKRNYKNYLLKGTMALPIAWHTDHHSGDTIDKIEKGTKALFNFSGRTFDIIQGIISLATSFAAMIFFDLISGGVALLISIFTFTILRLFDKSLIPGYKIVNKMENDISAKTFDALSNVTTVVILRVESLVLKSIDAFIKKPLDQFHLNNKINEFKWFSASVFGRIAVIVIVSVYLFSNISSGIIFVGTIYILFEYANRIRDTFFRFAYLYNDVIHYRASVSNTEELTKDFQTILIKGKKHLPKKWSSIAIKNLSFTYHPKGGRGLHLDNINLRIKRGERIALIGESGSGKSTFLKILRDLYTPQSLKLSINGKSTSKGFGSISESISLIPQDPEIFATTIRENITLGVEYNDDHLKIFTDLASITQVIDRLPKKLESSIVEKGVNLSGGERQRLALARGLLASVDKDIILMDEPTSSVDLQNELKIFKNIFKVFSKQTVLASVHRLHLLSLFETVYFFDKGKIIASGTFEELKKSSIEFQKLWEKYIEARDH